MADLFGQDPSYVAPMIAVELEVLQHRTCKSVLFRPEAPTIFDLEAGPLINKVAFNDLKTKEPPPEPLRSKRSVVFDVEYATGSYPPGTTADNESAGTHTPPKHSGWERRPSRNLLHVPRTTMTHHRRLP